MWTSSVVVARRKPPEFARRPVRGVAAVLGRRSTSSNRARGRAEFSPTTWAIACSQAATEAQTRPRPCGRGLVGEVALGFENDVRGAPRRIRTSNLLIRRKNRPQLFQYFQVVSMHSSVPDSLAGRIRREREVPAAGHAYAHVPAAGRVVLRGVTQEQPRAEDLAPVEGQRRTGGAGGATGSHGGSAQISSDAIVVGSAVHLRSARVQTLCHRRRYGKRRSRSSR